jgi:transcriptional regulator GlxA family with amidase domain
MIGIFLFDGVEELDAVGPWEVLAYWTHRYPQDGYRVQTYATGGEVVRCAKGMRILPDADTSDMPALEVFVHPGGQGTHPLLSDSLHLQWVRRIRETTPLMTSVCTGSLVYAAAGLLDSRPATTYWGSVELLAELDSSIRVEDTERFVDDGEVITSAGVSAGIDMALHLVQRLAGAARAREVRKGIQYDPAPPV